MDLYDMSQWMNLRVASILGRIGMPVASYMLKSALTWNGTFIVFWPQHEFTKKLKETSWYRNTSTALVNTAHAKGQKTINISASDGGLYNEWDFQFAFGGVDYQFEWEEVAPGTWMTKMTISDTYDFHKLIQHNMGILEKVWLLLNDFAYDAQERGNLTPFSYMMTIEDEIRIGK